MKKLYSKAKISIHLTVILHKKDKFGIQLYTICSDLLPPLFVYFVARSSTVPSLSVAKSIRLPLALGAAESRDGMTTKQRSSNVCIRDVKRAAYTPTDMSTLC